MYYLYVIQEDRDGLVKIGRTQDVKGRLNQLQTGSPAMLSILYQFGFKDTVKAIVLEEKLHHHFRHTRVRGEWFEFTEYIKEFFDTWNGEYVDMRMDVFSVKDQILESDHNILDIGRKCCEFGNYHGAEYLIECLQYTINLIRQEIPGEK